MCPLNITFLYKFLYLTSKYVPLILHNYKQLKNVRNSETYVSFIVSNQENIIITTERNWRERKKMVRWIILCVFFLFFFSFFFFCFKSYWTKLPSKILTLTSLVSFLFISNITGQTAFIPRSKVYLRFVFWNCRKFFLKKTWSQSVYILTDCLPKTWNL